MMDRVDELIVQRIEFILRKQQSLASAGKVTPEQAFSIDSPDVITRQTVIRLLHLIVDQFIVLGRCGWTQNCVTQSVHRGNNCSERKFDGTDQFGKIGQFLLHARIAVNTLDWNMRWLAQK